MSTIPTLETAVETLKSKDFEAYLTKFFYRGAREFRALNPTDPLELIELAWLQECNNSYDVKPLHFEFTDKGLFHVWNIKDWLLATERRAIVRVEMDVVRAEHEIYQARVSKVKASFIRMYGETNGGKRFANMMNGELDIPGETPLKAKFGL